MTEAKPLTKEEIANTKGWATDKVRCGTDFPRFETSRSILDLIATIEAREAEINKMRWLLGAAQQLIGARYDTWHRETLKTLAATEPKP